MASTINGTSTGNGGLISTGDDSGILNIQTNETTAITVDASQNISFTKGFTVGSTAFPAFNGYISGYQGGISQSTWTKVSLSAEDFDTNNNFNTSTYTFTPTVAGYYQLTGVASFGSAGGTYPSGGIVAIYKNSGSITGSQYSGANQIFNLTTATLVYMNGSTDTASLYVYMTGGTNGALNGGSYGTYLTGCMVRSA